MTKRFNKNDTSSAPIDIEVLSQEDRVKWIIQRLEEIKQNDREYTPEDTMKEINLALVEGRITLRMIRT